MTRKEADFIGGMNMCDEISNEAYRKIMCHCEEQEPCEDCISREHLLEGIASLKESPWFKDDTNSAMAIRKEAIEIVEDLCIRKEPSVNPQEPCEDAVSRQAVCNIVDAIRDCISVEGYWAILERLKKLPSVNPQKIGHWIDSPYDKDFLQCSECGSNWEKLIIENCNMDYCPNCGSYNGGN